MTKNMTILKLVLTNYLASYHIAKKNYPTQLVTDFHYFIALLLQNATD